MPVVSPGEFARQLRALDDESLAAFVADAWAARGWETAVDGVTVTATAGPFGGRERIQCVAAPRWGLAGLPPLDDGADVVVSTRETAELRAAAAERGVRFVGPEDARRMVVYGIDRESADRLLVAHLGRPLVGDEPRRSVPLWLPTASRAALAGGLVAVLVVAMALAVAGGGSLAAAGELMGPPGTASQPAVGDRSAPPTTADGREAVGRATDDAGRTSVGYPPGLGPSGVLDPDELATVHGQATVATTYDLLVVHRGSRDLLYPGRRWSSSRQTVERVDGSHYWHRFTGLERTPDGTRSVVVDHYADGTYHYRRTAGTPEPTYARGLIPTGDGNGVFTALAEAYLRRFLDTTASRVDVVASDGRTRFRVVATGTPRAFAGAVADYRAVAVVGPRGMVRHLAVSYTRLEPERDPRRAADTPTPSSGSDGAHPAGTVRFELVYRDVGEVTRSVPPWYGAARNATNETVVDLWPTDAPS